MLKTSFNIHSSGLDDPQRSLPIPTIL